MQASGLHRKRIASWKFALRSAVVTLPGAGALPPAEVCLPVTSFPRGAKNSTQGRVRSPEPLRAT